MNALKRSSELWHSSSDRTARPRKKCFCIKSLATMNISMQNKEIILELFSYALSFELGNMYYSKNNFNMYTV